MIEEKDFILREVQRLTLLLKQLISKVTNLDPGNADIGVNETDQALKSEFDLSLKEISVMSENDFLKKMESLNETHIQKLIELIFELIKKINDEDLDKSELIKKNILMIDLLDKKSKTFSFQRMNIKNQLQQWKSSKNRK